MLTLEERLAVVNLYEELGSYRAVAAATTRLSKRSSRGCMVNPCSVSSDARVAFTLG